MQPPASSPQGSLRLADEHLARTVPLATPLDTAAAVRDRLLQQEYEALDEVVVLESGRLAGVVPLARLVTARADASMRELMDPDPPVIQPGLAEEPAAWALVERGESTIAMVDADGSFRGLVPGHRLLAALLRSHDRDLARLGGYTAGTEQARRASVETVRLRLLHRLPWLILGLAGAMASAVVVGAFEDQIARVTLLALFLPAVVYMADAVGTQTETLLIRGLSIGVSVRTVLARELATGGLIGIAIGCLFFPFALLGWGDAEVALAVGLALVASCSIATLVAMILPSALQALGRDPAFGSGPIATIVQDLLSIFVYLAIATALVG